MRKGLGSASVSTSSTTGQQSPRSTARRRTPVLRGGKRLPARDPPHTAQAGSHTRSPVRPARPSRQFFESKLPSSQVRWRRDTRSGRPTVSRQVFAARKIRGIYARPTPAGTSEGAQTAGRVGRHGCSIADAGAYECDNRRIVSIHLEVFTPAQRSGRRRGGDPTSARDCRENGHGGRGWDRTSDPYDVNVVLSR